MFYDWSNVIIQKEIHYNMLLLIVDNVSLNAAEGIIVTTSAASASSNEQASGGENAVGHAEGAGHPVFATDYCATPDPLRQLLTALCRTAMEQAPDDPLYLAFARIMAKVNDLYRSLGMIKKRHRSQC